MSFYDRIDKALDESIMLEEMARIGYTDDSYEVYVNTDDPGNIAHFHYRKGKQNDYTFHTCIKIESAEYFHHTGKEDILNKQQRKQLVQFLKEKPKKANYKTNWEFLISMWNVNNSDVEIEADLEMPDYENLK